MPLKLSAPLVSEKRLSKTDAFYNISDSDPTLASFRQAAQEANERRENLLNSLVDSARRSSYQAWLAENTRSWRGRQVECRNKQEFVDLLDDVLDACDAVVARSWGSQPVVELVPWSYIRRVTVQSTLAACNLRQGEGKDERSVFWFKDGELAMTDDQFNRAWGSLPPIVADELYELSLEANPAWVSRRDLNSEEDAENLGEDGLGES